jgi:distribution and morphology protein 34
MPRKRSVDRSPISGKQANPLNVPRPSLDILNAPRILFAAAPLVVPMEARDGFDAVERGRDVDFFERVVLEHEGDALLARVPMTLRLSNLSLRAIVVLVVSRQKGITLVFKNDPR